MADVNNFPEPTFPTKRTSDLTPLDSSNESKKQKLETPETNFTEIQHPLSEIQKGEQKLVNKEEEEKEETKQKQLNEEEEKLRLNGKAEIDRKGKGILIEEDDDEEDDDDDEDEDEDDDDDDDSDDSDTPVIDELSDDDFVDDPLAEVNLDNILPSRTRRKTINPGSYDLPPEGDDDSDDPDA